MEKRKIVSKDSYVLWWLRPSRLIYKQAIVNVNGGIGIILYVRSDIYAYAYVRVAGNINKLPLKWIKNGKKKTTKLEE